MNQTCNNTAGYYYVKANTGAVTSENPNGLKYSTDLTNWGIVGYATTGSNAGWDNSIPLTYNATTKKWEGSVTLSAGEFKFRANNAWTINLGGDGPDADGSMNFGGPNLSVATAGTYNVVLDLSNPRQYTYSLN